MKWFKIKEKSPPKDETTILAALFNENTNFLLWAASIWYDMNTENWVCDFTDEELKEIPFHEFTHWCFIEIP